MNNGAMDVDESKDRLVVDFQSLSSHAEELIRATSSLSGDSIAAARAKLLESLSTVREGLRNADAYTREKAKYAAKMTDSYVHEKPWQAVAVAALAGVLFGALSGVGRR